MRRCSERIAEEVTRGRRPLAGCLYRRHIIRGGKDARRGDAV